MFSVNVHIIVDTLPTRRKYSGIVCSCSVLPYYQLRQRGMLIGWFIFNGFKVKYVLVDAGLCLEPS